MRRLIFILMIALLPLQGWTGVAMTTQMALANLVSHQTVAGQASINDASVQEMSAGMPADCALRMGISSDKAHEASGKTCTDCQACHLIALADPVQIDSTETFSVPFERSAPPYFASADVQRSQKPPIFFA
jgi:hypothetical protein